ncbi:DUF928 domain-containing protein [Leptothoe sp. PORK10 BA2]|uniref:DUF928 domain-containing protein n=1 Tax=Leptothoe sp. PORK10 BA2 TaxID=3110254 RepID=UPI002B2124A9|nr:DUF928 domain-containing protein [Leptothoe sp. PORK10 BA2]MEA5464414.1 DUF928 domain-containing protein [Leptothoe sp. PORK10 BA2]
MRSQNRLAPASFTLALLFSHLGYAPLAAAIPQEIAAHGGHSQQANLPPAPSTPPPNGQRRPGGSLGPESVCFQTPQPLTAITPVDVHGKTISDQPTFWFYTPYTAADVAQGEFSILTQDEQQEVYAAAFKLPDQPGLFSITLPADQAASLEKGAYYHWYLILDCTAEADSQNKLSIDGWIQPVAATPELEENIETISSELWYDTIDYLLDQVENSPREIPLWVELLEAVDLDEFTQVPVVGPVMMIDG